MYVARVSVIQMVVRSCCIFSVFLIYGCDTIDDPSTPQLKELVTFNYSDNTTTTSTAATVPDWFNEIIDSVDRYYLIDGLDRISTNGTNYHNANDPAIFGFRFQADSTKILDSITINPNTGGSVFVLFGMALEPNLVAGTCS